MQNMKILLTGAHFTPAVAVIEQLKKKPDIEIIYVGRKTTLEGDSSQSVESKVMPSLGVKFIPLISGRLQRSFTIYTIPSLLKIPIGIIQAFFIILFFRPNVILSFGGYVAVPVVFMGWLFSIPIIIHEQTLVSGLANRISSFFADKIALSFEENRRFGKPSVLTGNPIRKSVLESVKLDHREDMETKTVFVIGGNQGSHVINQALEGCLVKLLKTACVIHVTGDNKFKDFERLEQLKLSGKLGKFAERYNVKKWIGEEFGAILNKADLVISRAGINSLMEIAYMGKPAIVIPIPYLYKDEQYKNARYFENLGMARILLQSKLSSKSLLQNINIILNDLNSFKEKANGAKKIVVKDAAKRLALETMLLVNP